MDPTTTLFTFMLQTRPSVRSVQLLGSWDNFNRHYKMERDTRRDPGEWRGCHTFEKIVCDGDRPTSSERRGGLKMGQTYYYYYEVDGATETYNPAQPTTTTCPFLPGQPVNKLEVPYERRLRLKSASMNSLRNTDFKTMDPVDRFTTPKPPSSSGSRRECRIASASSVLPKRATRSVSPGPGWTGTARRLLGLRHKEGERGRKSNLREEYQEEEVVAEENDTETRSVTPSGSVRSRDLSPESLRKFLSDDAPSSVANVETMSLSIPDDIAEETDYDDDDNNFATSPSVERPGFTTLSPPPFQRGGLSAPPASHARTPTISTSTPAKLDFPRSHSTASASSSSLPAPASPLSSISQGLSQFSFFDDSDDDVVSFNGDLSASARLHPGSEAREKASKLEIEAPITSYSLPRGSADLRKHSDPTHVLPSLESPALVPHNEPGLSFGFAVGFEEELGTIINMTSEAAQLADGNGSPNAI